MNPNLTYTIDRYLKGKLSEEERHALEEKMQQDPLLAQEVTWQKDIFHALGDVRRAALKGRLDSVVIHPTPHFFGQRWLAAAAVGTLLLVGSAYYYLTSKEAELAVVPQKVAAPLAYPEAYILQRVPQRSAPAVVAPVIVPSENFPSEVKASRTSSATTQPVQPTVVPPQVTSQFDEDTPAVDYRDFEAPEKSALQENAYQKENVTVEALSDNRYTFHYRFFDNKLYLHGDFDRIPYKIIALNTGDDKKLFLEFDGSYYRISKHKTAVPLVEIKDPALLENLKSVGAIN